MNTWYCANILGKNLLPGHNKTLSELSASRNIISFYPSRTIIILYSRASEQRTLWEQAFVLCSEVVCPYLEGLPHFDLKFTLSSRKRAQYGISAHPPLWAKLPNAYSNIRPCVAALKNTAQMAGLRGLNFE